MTSVPTTWETNGTPRVIGHRGASGHAPENTLASFRKAAELGASWVEFDVRLSRDGEAVVFHDDELERTTDGSGPVAGKDLGELQSLDAGGWYAESFKGEPIPTLARTIEVLGELGLGVNVEIKAERGREEETARTAALVLKRDWPGSLPVPLISSFMLQSLAAALEAAPEFPRALCVDDVPGDWRQSLEAFGCGALHCRHDKLEPEQVNAVLEAGFTVRCFTVNDRKRAEELLGWGVEAVFSDYPERILT